jgi:SSS family solute:Na+ symporter/sodium/proline symporter
MLYTTVIAIYVLLLFSVAVMKSRKIKTQDDFMVAGRHVPVLMLVGTLVCTWIGSGSLFGGAGLAFRMGFAQLWMSAGAWVGIAIVYFLAHRVRRIAEYTVPDILEKRYNKWARILGTIAVIIAYVSIAGYQFRGGGRLLNIITEGGVSPEAGAIITCAFIIAFTLLAGMVSIVSIDLFNGIVMTFGIILAVPFALKAAGGWDGVTTALPADHFFVFGPNDEREGRPQGGDRHDPGGRGTRDAACRAGGLRLGHPLDQFVIRRRCRHRDHHPAAGRC